MKKCVNCKKTDQQVPLLQMQYRGDEVHICPQCLPALIHKPASLKEKLPGVENIQPPRQAH
jgi:hypothetical protein